MKKKTLWKNTKKRYINQPNEEAVHFHEETTTLTLYIDAATFKILCDISEQEGIDPSVVAENMLQKYIREFDGDIPPSKK